MLMTLALVCTEKKWIMTMVFFKSSVENAKLFCDNYGSNHEWSCNNENLDVVEIFLEKSKSGGR